MKKTLSVITIDGPSGTGKGTLAIKLCETLGFHYLDSGALYRTLALGIDQAGIAYTDDEHIKKIIPNLNIQFTCSPPDGVSVVLNGKNVTQDLRQERVGMFASHLSAKSYVRQLLLKHQRDCARPPGLVTDGRDMGTAIFPDAQLKIFLTASSDIRAKRRYLQLKEQGRHVSLREVEDDLKVRDHQDLSRKASPLRPAEDAAIIDSSTLSVDQVHDKVLSLWEKSCSRL